MIRQIFHNRIPIPVRLILSTFRGLVYHIAVPVLLWLQRAAQYLAFHVHHGVHCPLYPQ